jgi:predicted DCC family thiol-disulfide oxidoreductase YuxK
VPRLRAPAWTALGALETARLLTLHSPGDAAALLAALLFAFDPGWVRSVGGAAPDTLFYDGTCGLCHRAVRFAIAEDVGGRRLRFAPLGGRLFRDSIAAEQRARLPDSLVLLTSDGRVLTRSRAVRRLLMRLGGWWTVLGRLAVVVPAPAADLAYDVVARVRYRLFARPPEACPLLPAAVRSRFILD